MERESSEMTFSKWENVKLEVINNNCERTYFDYFSIVGLTPFGLFLYRFLFFFDSKSKEKKHLTGESYTYCVQENRVIQYSARVEKISWQCIYFS